MQPRSTLSIKAVRSQFPALQRIHNGHPVAYFDGPGGTQVPRSVVEAMSDYLFHHNANTHWAYPTSNETDKLLEDARQALADLLNARPDEIVFGQNMTTLTLHLGRTLGRRFKPGDEIIVTELDHHANVDTWRSLTPDFGINIRVLPMNTATGRLEIEKLPGLINERTRLIAIGAASNAIGTVNDVASVCRAAREAGALSFVDAVHFAPHALIDVKAIGCDLLACSAYKFYGPHIGILFGRFDLLEELDFPRLRPAPQTAPEKAETGTQSHESIVGAAAAVDFIASLGQGETRRARLADAFAAMHERDSEFGRKLWDGLSQIKNVKTYGPPPGEKRTSLVSFTVGDLRSKDVSAKLAEKGLLLSHGDFYAQTVVERYGLEDQGFVRAGCSVYTTIEEVERLLDGVREINGLRG